MKHPGFTLIEMLIYSALLSILALISFSWLNNMIQTTTKMQQESYQVLVLHTALQRLAADIQMAESQENKWKVNRESLEFYSQNNALCWCKEKDKLYRVQNRSKALIATKVTRFDCNLITKANHLKGVECFMSIGNLQSREQMKVYNG